MKYIYCFFGLVIGSINLSRAQTIKILFDATKAETAGNADWVIDADVFNLSYSTGPATIGGNEANAQIVPTPAQSGITSSTAETYWKGGISNWGIDCVKKGYTVETLPYNGLITYGDVTNAQDLSHYKVFIVCEPNIVFTSSEKTALLAFVSSGGGLFMVSDHDVSDRNNDGWDSPHIWNDLFTNNGIINNPFGFTFDYANFSETTTNIPNFPGDSLLHGNMGNVTAAQWNNGTSITINTAANSSAKGIIYKTGASFGNSNIMCAYARYGNGKVVALGDSSPCDDGTGDTNDNLFPGYTGDASGNHQRLIMNATIWLATNPATSLPIHFLSFYGKPGKADSVDLGWSATEVNAINGIYEIQRSEDGFAFTTIKKINAKNKLLAEYSYNDTQLKSGKFFYRIAFIDNGMNAFYSNIIEVRMRFIRSVSIFPNPAQNELNVQFSELDKEGTLIIYDSKGRAVKQCFLSKNQKNQHINLFDFRKGLYYLHIVVDNGQYVRKFIKR